MEYLVTFQAVQPINNKSKTITDMEHPTSKQSDWELSGSVNY